ncbi:DHA2 family efflux MFS transporter permease subunit [Ureibacillus manganicus]|uniref:Multidrug MFS transporter n=1 Tax=Ureibacillus manganicus DSM 26584 TaxID=1384049 RepID=A0A0A3I6T9_9BACL|nr:DHA2 family efflux MFS transporter permease subunit [Ureibacillus manganicus]KGR79235.1 multidrug MFS transporter [Ureibacillus manganicus DSM 26584]
MESHLKVRNPKLIAFVLMAGAFIGLFSETALNMALTDIMGEFVVDQTVAQWVTTGYLLVLAIFVPISAFLVRWFTTKQLVIAGLILSLAGALLGALAVSFPMLMAGRVVQAIGTGIIIPVMNIVVLVIFPVAKRGLVMGVMGLVITTAPAVGPTLAGFIISALDWTWIFWIVAILYVLLLFSSFNLDNASDITKPKIDLLSILLSTVGLVGVIYGLSMLAGNVFTAIIVWLPILIGLIAILLFGIRQLKMETPMINIRVFNIPMFTLGTLTMFLGILIILAAGILLPMYLKGALLVSAAVAGLSLLPGNAVNVILAPVVGGLFDKSGGNARGFIIFGALFIVIGTVIFATTLSATTSLWLVILAFIILFFGMTFVMMPAQTNAMNVLPRKWYADGAAAMNTLNQVAGAAGTSIAITLFTTGQKNFETNSPSSSQQEILAAGTQTAFTFVAVVAVIILVLSFFTKNPKKQ